MEKFISKKRRIVSPSTSASEEDNVSVDLTEEKNLSPSSSPPKTSTFPGIPGSSKENDINSGNKSEIQSYFKFVWDNGVKFGICVLCEKKGREKKIKMKDCNTSGLKKHIFSGHKNIYEQLQLTKDRTEQRQTTLPYLLKKVNTATDKNFVSQESFEALIVNWVCLKYLPFNFFDDEPTQKMFEKINSRLKVPKKDALRCKVITKFNLARENVARILRNNKSKISFTVDGWTSVNGKSFYGITGHFIDDDWRLQSLALDFVASNGKHTGKDIAQIFFATVCEFKIQGKIQGITVDNASSNTKFMDELHVLLRNNDISFDFEQQHFRCFAHLLNLGVQDILKFLKMQQSEHDVPEDSDEDECEIQENDSYCVLKLRNLFKKIRLSEQWQNKLRTCCDIRNLKYVSPNIDVSTRWNSTYDMMKTEIYLKHALSTLCENYEELTHLKLTNSEWLMIETVAKFLGNFKSVSVLLGGNKYATLPLVIVVFNILLDNLEKQMMELDAKDGRTELDESLILAFKAGRDKMLKHYSKANWIYCASLILDPRHKLDTFKITKCGQEMESQSIHTLNKLYYSNYEKEDTETEVQTERSPHETQTTMEFEEINLSMLYDQTEQTRWTEELEAYSTATRAHKDCDILIWWKTHEKTYPKLAAIARDLFSVTATSVPAERLFSKAGLIIRKHRNCLNSESARSLLCMNSWLTCDLSEKIFGE